MVKERKKIREWIVVEKKNVNDAFCCIAQYSLTEFMESQAGLLRLLHLLFPSFSQDVVYALAHATGKTGRFTLIESWRNNERLLAPQEHPLKVSSRTELCISQNTSNIYFL